MSANVLLQWAPIANPPLHAERAQWSLFSLWWPYNSWFGRLFCFLGSGASGSTPMPFSSQNFRFMFSRRPRRQL